MTGLGPHLATSLRYALTATVVGAAMVLVFRCLRRLGRRDETAAGWAFILPWLVGGSVLSLLPMGLSLYLSFTKYGVLSAPRWVGWEHYVHLVTVDPAVRDAAWNTVSFAFWSVGLGIVSSLAAAMLLSLRKPLMGVWRTVYYLPSVIPAVSTALLWRWILEPRAGLINGLLRWARLPAPGWFTDPDWVIPAFVILSLQGACGNNMVIFLARLRGIDASLYEAGMIDGAGAWSRFRHITLPQLSPVILYHVVMGVIGSLQIFTQPMFIRTPGRSGLFYAVYIYRTGWQELRMGYACALSWVLFAVLIALSLAVFRSSRRWVSYEQEDIQASPGSDALRPRGLGAWLWYLAVVVGGMVMLVPILWMVSTSLKSPEDLRAVPPVPLSWPLRWENYARAWSALPFGRFVLNTAFVAGLASAGQVLTSLLVAYGFARFRFRGRGVLFGVLIATLMIPATVMMVPVFLIWRTIGLVGTYDPLVLGALLGGSPLLVFIAHQFFKTLPRELEEAAWLDGASHARTFFQFILPTARPMVLVLGLIAFQTHWNDFLGPLLYLNRLEDYTLTLGVHFFQGSTMGEAPKWHWMMAITVVMSLPTVAIFFITQRAFFRTR